VISILSNIIHDTVDINIDEITHYGNSFEEALINLGESLKRCE